MGSASWVVRRGSWVVGRGSWVVGRASWVARDYCVLRVLTLKSPNVIFE